MDGGEEKKHGDGSHHSNLRPQKGNDSSAKASKSEPAVSNLSEDAVELRIESKSDGEEQINSDEDSENSNEDATLSWLRTGKVSFADDANLVRIFNENSGDIGQNLEDTRRENEFDPSWSFDKGKEPSKERFGLLNATLANLFWKYPNVHQTVEVFPILTNRTALSTARKRSAKLKDELNKEPGKSRGAIGDPKRKSLAQKSKSTTSLKEKKGTGIKTSASKAKLAKPDPEDTHRNSQQKHYEKLRRFSESRASVSHSHHSMYTFASDNPVDKGAETSEILGQIREKNEDIEQNSCKARYTKWKRRCMAPFEKCFGSQRCTCVVFAILITVVVLFCIAAILYPIINVSTQIENDHKKPNIVDDTDTKIQNGNDNKNNSNR